MGKFRRRKRRGEEGKKQNELKAGKYPQPHWAWSEGTGKEDMQSFLAPMGKNRDGIKER